MRKALLLVLLLLSSPLLSETLPPPPDEWGLCGATWTRLDCQSQYYPMECDQWVYKCGTVIQLSNMTTTECSTGKGHTFAYSCFEGSELKDGPMVAHVTTSGRKIEPGGIVRHFYRDRRCTDNTLDWAERTDPGHFGEQVHAMEIRVIWEVDPEYAGPEC